MRRAVVLSAIFLCAAATFAAPQTVEEASTKVSRLVPLTVDAGAPLRVYLTKRLTKRLNEPVRARLIEPIFAFDREVIPAGTEVLGRVSRLVPASKFARTMAIIGGDFTPLHQARVEFTTLTLPDGRQMALHTVETTPLTSIYSPQPPRKKAKPQKAKKPEGSGGVLGTGKQEIQKQINAAVNSRTQGVADIVRGPDKRERLEEFLLMKLPYRPQWVRKGTRFDADLREPLQFGSATVSAEMLQVLGSSPPSDSIVHARLITPLNSSLAKQGEAVQAVISQPLFSPDKKLILPEGTHLIGGVTMVHRARWFHRGGQLRFNFQRVELPAAFAASAVAAHNVAAGKTTLASLEAAESSGRTAIKVDKEGSVKAVEPKTRFIAPAISVLIAAKSLDNDHEREHLGSPDANVSGRTLGGASGFGLLGAAAAQASRTVGSVLGFYGMAWSVYSNVVARGAEVEFKDNAAVDIRFGSRAPAQPSKFRQILAPVAQAKP
jgi:hypothetical protein